jgi:hypothetical protein
LYQPTRLVRLIDNKEEAPSVGLDNALK